MKRSIVVLLLGSLWSAGCGDPEQEKRIADLEAKVAALESKGGAAGPAGAAPTASPEEEQAAATLLKDATDAMEKMDYETAKAKIAELKEKHGATRAAKAAVRLEDELSVIGKAEAPVTVEKWFQGSEAEMKGGKATLYVFWEVWCPHCRREVPKLAETYTKYHDQGLGVVGLTKMSRDVTEQQVNDFIKENKLPYPVAKEQGDAMSSAYGVKGIPAAAVVKDGKVVWRGHPAKLTDEMIKGWL
ncbi:MAG: TlpA disulfide reductase family protein [Myxococcota bacterium]